MESNYFRNRKEIDEFFKNTYFKFKFFSEGIIYFDTLFPIDLNGDLFDFQLGFFFNGESFFDFSSLEDWLDKMEIESITKVQNDNSFEKLYQNE